jgi:hypothetical protein
LKTRLSNINSTAMSAHILQTSIRARFVGYRRHCSNP